MIVITSEAIGGALATVPETAGIEGSQADRAIPDHHSRNRHSTGRRPRVDDVVSCTAVEIPREMKVLFSHFYNEEFLLPFWLDHHRRLFDHGVLIDYGSTDLSREICRELVSDWDVVTSENKEFSAIMVDFEVMKYEQRYRGHWKLVLNTTEFLVGDGLDHVIDYIEQSDHVAGQIDGAIMVDVDPTATIDRTKPLVAQKHHGIWESDFPYEEMKLPWLPFASRTRILHRYDIGAYHPGRHYSYLPRQVDIQRSQLGIWWYAFSPWTEETVGRKLQIQSRIDKFDRKAGFGVQHFTTREELDHRRKTLLEFARDLAEDRIVGSDAGGGRIVS